MANTRASQARAKKVERKLKSTKKRTRAQVLARPRKARRISGDAGAVNTVLPGGKIPRWHTLPYQLLLSIFRFAAWPLVDQNFNRTGSASWLIDTATACKAFTEPALSALYYSPPVVASHQVLSLRDLLINPQPKVLDYSKKIQELSLHTEEIRLRKMATEVEELIRSIRNLKGLGLYGSADDPRTTKQPKVYAAIDPEYRWLNALVDSEKRLFKLHLNTVVTNIGNHRKLEPLLNGHRFESLTQLSLSSLDHDDMRTLARERSLHALPVLCKLTLMRAFFPPEDTVTGDAGGGARVSELVPHHLQYLAFLQCSNLGSERLSEILEGVGNHLTTLELRHNDDLSLSFISHLSCHCARLERLVYDLSLFSPFSASSFHEPSFVELLTGDDAPTWPDTLQEIEMTQLRHWDTKAADNFFNSLLESAPKLKFLQRIHITASVGAGWRERALFRENVIGPLYKAFLRARTEPRPVHRIIPASRALQAADEQEQRSNESRRLPRRSNRNEASKSIISGTDAGGISERRVRDAPAATRRSERVKAFPSREGTSTSEQEHDETELRGVCDYVHIRVDNLRPAEEQLNEAHFLDSEPSGDEAWDPVRGDIEDD